MHLKSLNIKGFKSFASSTVLRLEPGITCIVGPNGSGKSNVVDALAWVMGEQGAKTLRGASMADVIFAGTTGKPALGRAQVELTIDNTDGALPIEYSEVTISRTLFRSGGSEYAINGAPARLLDVQELLSDTGMGKQMHVIVGQGQLDAVLRASAEDRRGFIDEAAGVLKHRRRKERALRKLESMDANLVRVLDLTDEIKRQLRPLARQAKAAKEAQGIQDTIEWAKKRLLADDIDKLWLQLQKESDGIAKFTLDGDAQEKQLDLLKEENAKLERDRAELNRVIDHYQEMLRQFDLVKERLAAKLAIIDERKRQVAGSVLQVSAAAIELADEKAAEAAQISAAAQEKLLEAQSAAEKASEERAHAEEQLRIKRADLQERETLLLREQAQLTKIREEVTRAQSQFESAQKNASLAASKLEESEERLAFAKRTAADLNLNQELEEAGDSADLAKLHAQSIEDETKARKSLEEAEEERRQAQARLAKWQATYDALAQSIKRQHIVHLPSDDAGQSNWAPQFFLDEMLKVEEGWEEAIAALLRPFDKAVILQPEDNIEAALGWAKKNDVALRAIRAGAPLDSSSSESWDKPASQGETSGIPGALQALQVVSYPKQLVGAITHLLGGKLVCADLEEANQILTVDSSDSDKVIATSDGRMIGHYTAEGEGNEGVSVLALRAQWIQAGEKAAEAKEELKLLEKKVATRKEELLEASALQAKALTALRQWDVKESEIAQERARIAARIAGAEEEVQRFARDNEAATKALEDAGARLRESKAKLKDQPSIDAGEYLAPWRADAEQAEKDAVSVREKQMNAKLALRGIEEQSRAATRTAEAFKAQAKQMRQNRQMQEEQERRREASRTALQGIASRAEDAHLKAVSNSQTVAQELRVRQERKANLEKQLQAGRSDLEKLQWQLTKDGQARQQAEVLFAQTRTQFHQALERCEELLEVELSEKKLLEADPPRIPDQLSEEVGRLLGHFGPDQPMLDSSGQAVAYSRQQVQARLVSAQREISRLGQVNPLAVEEYDSLNQRHEFLLEQVGDLKKSKSDLLQIINDVDQRIEEAFVSAFADTQEAFEHVFEVLFPGGKGRLSLTDPDDPLHTGVEIYARPAGKKVTRLSLLSGGERSLAALAYLIAIFKARPSPFYVMDEVEAALDDLNISRVLTIFEQLRENSQLILITHQKRTMEIADALYGVTMRDGVTKVVSHKMK